MNQRKKERQPKIESQKEGIRKREREREREERRQNQRKRVRTARGNKRK